MWKQVTKEEFEDTLEAIEIEFPNLRGRSIEPGVTAWYDSKGGAEPNDAQWLAKRVIDSSGTHYYVHRDD